MAEDLILKKFLEQFWFAPSDALLRAVETLIWQKQVFKKPVLNIGTGDGRNDSLVFAKFAQFEVGIDSDPKVIGPAKRCGRYKEVLQASAEKMPFADSSFRTIIASSTFEHIKGNDLKAVSEVARILKKGGRFYLTVPLPYWLTLLRQIGIQEKEINWYNRRVLHYKYRTEEEWQAVLAKNGLKIISSRRYFGQAITKVWWRLFKISVFRPYRRELWSYLKDSPYGCLVPQGLVKFILKRYLSNYRQLAFSENGGWIFMVAEKKK